MVFLYRKSSGEVVGASVDQSYAQADATVYATVTDPPTPNGTDLGVPKRWDTINLRNATAGEITGFAAFRTSDDVLVARAGAVSKLQSDAVLRKVLRAIVGQVVTQLNVLRTNPVLGLSAITEAQAETAIVTAINAGTFD